MQLKNLTSNIGILFPLVEVLWIYPEQYPKTLVFVLYLGYQKKGQKKTNNNNNKTL